MKKLLIAGIIGLCAINAQANPHHGYHGGHHTHRGNWSWVVPAVVGGAVVYAATRPVVVQQQPVIVQQPPVYTQQQVCGPWTETRNADGSVTITRTCQ